MNQPKCYSYVRFSTIEQRKGDSHRRQTAAAEEWAKKHGYVLDDSLRPDLGISAYSGEHRAKGALGGFLTKVKQGLIIPGSILLVENLDRLSREQALDALGLFTDIIKADIKIVTLADGMEYTRETINSNMMQLMMSLVILSRGHEESAIKSKRLREAWRNKRAKLGERKLTARAPAWLCLDEKRTEFFLIPERAEVVRRVFEMKLQGIGCPSIVKILNQENAWSPKNGWRESYVVKILNTPAVIGEFQPHKYISAPDGKKVRQPAGDIILDYFPRCVSDELFHAVQAQFAKNRGRGGKNGVTRNLFGHLAKCGYCGSPMTFVYKISRRTKGGQFLLCDKVRRGLGCHRHTVQYSDFEKLILNHCRGLSVADLLPDGEQSKTDIEAVKQRLQAIQGENVAILAKVNNLADAIADSSDKRVREHLQASMSDLMDRADTLTEQERATGQELAQLSNAGDNTQAWLDSMNELIAFMDEESPEDVATIRMRLRDKLRGLIDRIEIHPVGRFRMTPERVDALIQGVLDVQPELAGTDELEKLRVEALNQINNKDFGRCTIFFHGGSFRTILMGQGKQILAIDFDKEAGRMINSWIEEGIERSVIFTGEISL